jgi:GMP synthase-like glutamine amidotransferase
VNPVLIVTHLPDRADGIVRQCLRSAGCEVIERNPADREPLPSAAEISGVVSLGGRQSATRVDADPFIAAEVVLLTEALQARVPVLGMCLGAQLLAVAAGGEATHTGSMYAGWPELVTLPAAADDPVCGGLPDRLPVLKWHEDMIKLPAGACQLATTPGPGAALFRVGEAAWGSQAHLELTPAMLDSWLIDPGDVAEVEGSGHDIATFRTESRAHLEVQMAAARPMFYAFGRLTSSMTSSTA